MLDADEGEGEGQGYSDSTDIARNGSPHIVGRRTVSLSGEVSDADHGTSDLMSSEEVCPVKAESAGNDEAVDGGNSEKNAPQDAGTLSGAPFQDDVDRKLFETVEEAPHPSGLSGDRPRPFVIG